MNWEHQIVYAARTDVGMRRINNQDYCLASPAGSESDWQQRGHVFVVADGMGAHAVGELASKLAATTIVHTYRKLLHLEPPDALQKAVEESNATVYQRGRANRDFEGMGTTATTLVLHPLGAFVAHVGDSRAYRVRANRIEQLSCDHSLAWDLVRTGRLTEQEARAMVPTNVITRSLGPNPTVDVDVEGPYDVRAGDVFILCSDGLSGSVSAPEMAALVTHLPVEEAADRLIGLANLRGGADNITVVVVEARAPVGGQPPGLWKGFRDFWLRFLWSYLLDLSGLWRAGEWALAGAVTAIAGGLLFRWLDWPNWRVPLVAGLALGLAGVGALAAALWWKRRPPTKRRVLRSKPYVAQDVNLTPEFFGYWFRWLDETRDLAVEQAWNVQWDDFYTARNQLHVTVSEGKTAEAVRHFAECVRILADAQRRRRGEEMAELLRRNA